MASDVNRGLGSVRRPPLWASATAAALIVAAMAYLRIIALPDRVFPLAYSLPLLLALWDRRLRLMHLMAVCFTAVATVKAFWLLPEHASPASYDALAWSMHVMDIWVVAGVVHALVRSRQRLEGLNAHLEHANAELEAANEELSAREEEIARQNEELQSQTEELEQQTEELRQQAEEMEHQGREVQELNDELLRRERGMQTLLESARWMRSDLDEQVVLAAICQAAVQAMSTHAVAAALVQDQNGKLLLRSHCGFGVTGSVLREVDFSRSFAALVLERGQTAYLQDVQLRPDVELHQPAAGKPFRSVLATPVWLEGRPIAALKVYSAQPHHWTREQFHVLEWLAAQCSLALQAMSYQRELEIKRRDAEEASIQKTRFLAAVSHDVRTPTNAISLLADLIQQTAAIPERAAEIAPMARDLKSSARALVELVSDVLDLARFDAGKSDLQIAEFPLASLVHAEVRQALPLAQARDLRLIATMPQSDPWVRSDRLKLARVLSNLIGNALKFTDAGQVEVRCVAEPTGGAELRVIDTGVGIAPEQLPRIFDEFHQLRNPERDRSKGTGLGLAICQRLVEVLGCAISVSSTIGRGTTFVVRLPAEMLIPPPQLASTPDPDPLPEQAPLNGVRILLVEDHDLTRKTVAQLLSGEGAIISQARTGREAIHLLGHGPHEVILLDLMLPDIDGTDVLRQIQAQRPNGLRCVLAVSGDTRESRIDEIKRLGADELIAKPVSIERLSGIIKARCARSPHRPAPTSELKTES